MIPEELQRLPQWTYSYSEQEPKRPTHFNYIPKQGLTYQEAITHETTNVSVGLYVTKSDPYILGDIDHVEDVQEPLTELPAGLIELLTSFPTYSESSPSGKGIRFIYKFKKSEEKIKVSNKYFLSVEIGKQAQVNVGPPWMRMTGKEIPLSSGKVSEVTWEALEKAFNISYVRDSNVIIPAMSQATFAEVEEHVMRIPLDQNPRVKRAFKQTFNEGYQHYAFWVKVIMALHCYAEATSQLVECMSLAVKWSALDPSSFSGEEDVINHWKSLSNTKCEIISHKTLFKLANLCTLRWPRPRAKKKSESITALTKPLNSEVINYQYFFSFYNIIIYVDIGNPAIYYVTGDEDVLSTKLKVSKQEKLFDQFYGPFDIQRLVSAFMLWLQEVGFIGLSRGLLRDIMMTISHSNSKEFDPVSFYFSTPFEKLPSDFQENIEYYHRSTFDDLFDCLEIEYMTSNQTKEKELYRNYYKKWLSGLIRSMHYRDLPVTNNCVLLLTGPEQIRKTSHFKYMLPKWMRERYISFTTHGFRTNEEIRDITKISATSRIIVWDEFDQLLNEKTESGLKKVIDNTPQTIIDKYETIPRTVHPISIYGATSNLREFKLGDEGSRRLFHIPVSWVHTEDMEKICWHKLINDLTEEVGKELAKGVTPWLLSSDQLQYQRNLHGMLRSKNNIDVMLEETFDFDGNAGVATGVLIGVTSVQKDKTGRLMTTKQILDTLSRYHQQAYGITRPALIHALKRLCSYYTRTTTQPQIMLQPAGHIEKGVFHQNIHKRWVMPPLRDDIVSSAFDSVM